MNTSVLQIKRTDVLKTSSIFKGKMTFIQIQKQEEISSVSSEILKTTSL